jgi:hypothetical protein
MLGADAGTAFPALSQFVPLPAGTSMNSRRKRLRARGGRHRARLSGNDEWKSFTHPHSTATDVTGAAKASPQQPQLRPTSQGAGHGSGKRRRAPPGGRVAPARTVRPWGGRPAPSLYKLNCKVPPYATTSIGFPTPAAYPPQVPVAASAQPNYNICGRV